MHEFISASIGGIMIGTAAVLLMAIQGNIMGVSGILSRLLPPTAADWHWRVAFLLGLVLAPLFATLISDQPPVIEISGEVPLLIGAGLLVGFGTALGNGCTSGHGVCGISRFSLRSIVATIVFIGAAIFTVYIMRQIGGAG